VEAGAASRNGPSAPCLVAPGRERPRAADGPDRAATGTRRTGKLFIRPGRSVEAGTSRTCGNYLRVFQNLGRRSRAPIGHQRHVSDQPPSARCSGRCRRRFSKPERHVPRPRQIDPPRRLATFPAAGYRRVRPASITGPAHRARLSTGRSRSRPNQRRPNLLRATYSGGPAIVVELEFDQPVRLDAAGAGAGSSTWTTEARKRSASGAGRCPGNRPDADRFAAPSAAAANHLTSTAGPGARPGFLRG